MNLKDQNYAQFALVREMMDTVETIRKFDPDCTKQIAEQVKQVGNIYFPGKEFIEKIQTLGYGCKYPDRWILAVKRI